MPIFRCNKCGNIENTALSGFWHRWTRKKEGEEISSALCSECDPEIGKWHGIFEKTSAKGYMLANDGFLYSKEHVESDNFKWRMEHQNLKVVKEIVVSCSQK